MVEKYGNNIYTFYMIECCNNSHASEICKKFDGILTHIKSASIQAFINKTISKTSWGRYWIGLYQIGDDTTKWEWSDKEKVNYTNWHYGEPNDKNEKCAEYRDYWNKWHDINCSTIRKFICENSKLLAMILISSNN